MRIPEITYAFRVPADVAEPTLDVFHREGAISAVNSLISPIQIVGLRQDRILVLTNVNANATPGAGQIVQRVACTLTRPDGEAIQLFREYPSPPAVAGQEFGYTWSGNVWIGGSGPGSSNITVLVQSVFDAMVVANIGRGSISGFIIPRANVGYA